MDAKSLLAKVPLFAEVLSPADLDALALVAWREDFDRGAVLMREGEPGNSLLVIASGDVSITVAGRSQTVATLGPGDVVGEMSLLAGAPRSATVAALRPVVAYRIGKAQLQPILGHSPSLYERFAEMVEKRKAELGDIYGPGLEKLYFASRAQLVSAMRSFFGKAG
ncbi:MAG: cyclic nucleotide-binding domain-containing protein [Bauldia sp.]|nr:cyclic nucleotide-binding domain-containing protein [Bauldia sp.]